MERDRLTWKFDEARRLTALDPNGEDRYKRLSRLRARLAAEAKLPAYQILSNRLVLELAERPPSDEAALAAHSGVGRIKLLAYGAEIIAVTRAAPSP